MDVARTTEELYAAWASIKQKSKEMAMAEAQAKPSPSDEAQRAERAEKLASRMPGLREEAAEVMPLLPKYHEALKTLSTIDGERHVLALLLQRCQWRRWGRLRMERIQALTVLKGTRASVKRASELTVELNHAKGQESVVNALAPFTRSPACSLTLRPAGLSCLPKSETVESFRRAIKLCLIRDLGEAFGVPESRLEIVMLETATDESLGLELQANSGACDLILTIHHEDTDSEDMLPATLLDIFAKEMRYLENIRLPRLYRMTHVLPGRSLEFKEMSRNCPDTERVNVRRELSELQKKIATGLDEAKLAEQEAIKEKRLAANHLLPGQLGPRAKTYKLATIKAKGEEKMCEELMGELPERGDNDDPTTLQFDWLPTQLFTLRKEVKEALTKPKPELERLQPCVDAREIAKAKLSHCVVSMAGLGDESLPVTTPPLENAGKLLLDGLQGSFYHHRELLMSRRSLACAVSYFAADLTVKVNKFEELHGINAKEKEPEEEVKPKPGGSPLMKGPPGMAGKGKKSVTGGPGGGNPLKPFGGGGGGGEKSPPRAIRKGKNEWAGAAKALEAGGPLQRVKALMLLTPNPELKEPEPVIAAAPAPATEAEDDLAELSEQAPAVAASKKKKDEKPEGFFSITPERVLEMVDVLGLDINPAGEPEYNLLWIAVEAISAPLPPLWRRLERPERPPTPPPEPVVEKKKGGFGSSDGFQEAKAFEPPGKKKGKGKDSRPDTPAKKLRLDLDGNPMEIPYAGSTTDSKYYYEHSVSGAASVDHPLLPVYRKVLASERLKKDRARPWSTVEMWYLFAGEGDVLYFYNFSTRHRSRELPPELMAQKANREAEAAGTKEAKAELQKKKSANLSGGKPTSQEAAQLRKDFALGRPIASKTKKASAPEAAPAAAAAGSTAHAKATAKKNAADLTSRAKAWRHVSLELRPRPLPELLVAAGRFDVDVFAMPAMLWLVDAIVASDYW